MKDKFGFGFWLGWIVRFAGGLVLAAAAWTWFFTRVFGSIEGEEVVLTWCLAVFGSWFVLLVPFMRKKEQIWKRLNQDQEKAVDIWLKGMGVFIALLVASAAGWTLWLAGAVRAPGFQAVWLKAVLSTWLAAALPFLAWLYRQSDKLFRAALERQTKTGPAFRTQFVAKERRVLPAAIQSKLKDLPPVMDHGHVVSVTLRDGRRVPHVFVLNGAEILGVYDRTELGFEPADIIAVEEMPALPEYDEARWLRLDARI